MEYPYPATLGILLVFFLVAFLPPRMHVGIRLLIQAMLGLIVYFGMKDVMFALPFPDQLPISDLMNGPQDGKFNTLSFGFLAFVLSALMSLFVAGVRKFISSRRKET
jgi:hypothetical protein